MAIKIRPLNLSSMLEPGTDLSSQSWKKWTILCIVIGTALRLVLSAISYGTNDAGTWLKIAEYTRQVGIVQAYSESAENNHPLIPVYWAQLARALGGPTGFYFVFKLAPIAADAGSAWVAARMAARSGGARRARLTAAAVAFSPIAMLISGYHCNSDSVYALLCLLSAEMLMGERFFAGGLALGAAINVKLIPVMLIPLAFSLCRRWRDAGRVLGALLICILPFVPLLLHPAILQNNLLRYASNKDQWGVYAVLYAMLDNECTRQFAYYAGGIYPTIGRMLIIALILALAAASWRWRRWSAVQLYLGGVCIFFCFTPGFGLQYLTLPVGFLAVGNIVKSWQFNVTAGLFAGITYAVYLWPTFPLQTVYSGHLPLSAAVFGVLAWGVLAQAGATVIFRPGDELAAVQSSR